MTLWVVRAGEDLRYLEAFVQGSLVGVGWAELPESPVGLTRSRLTEIMTSTYPDASGPTVSNYVGQVWSFVNAMTVGDLVLVPLESSHTYRVARVMGPAVSGPLDEKLAASRPVEWLAEELKASVLGQDLRNSLGAIMTVFRPRIGGAEWRIDQALATGEDPGSDAGPDDRSGAWIFQANPTRHDFLTAVAKSSEMIWAVNQHRDAIEPGDRIWIRLTGAQAGVYAVGRVVTRARPEPNDFGDWSLDLVIEAMIDPPLSRAELEQDPELSKVSALSGRMGTNLSLTASADLALEDRLQDRLVPLVGAAPEARLLENRLYVEAERLSSLVEAQLLAELKAIQHTQFEEVCALYLRHLGCDDVSVVGAAHSGSQGDGGIDVEGTLAQAGLPAVRLQVQAKRVAGSVAPNVVTQLRGSLAAGAYGMIITTGYFTKSAIAEAARIDRSTIRLVDGRELAHVLVENGLGVRKSSLSLPRLDIASLMSRLESERP